MATTCKNVKTYEIMGRKRKARKEAHMVSFILKLCISWHVSEVVSACAITSMRYSLFAFTMSLQLMVGFFVMEGRPRR